MKNTIFQGTIEHSGFVVPDIEAAVEFFTNILGFEVLFRPGRMHFMGDGDSNNGMTLICILIS
ncbi:VOC family protein [Bacillus sp. FSL K6-0994]|uniref:VOC family protein n=1 Tax=Bacillus sp. FSL K6-0994 TaxID=2921457 RepID=UPI00315B054E